MRYSLKKFLLITLPPISIAAPALSAENDITNLPLEALVRFEVESASTIAKQVSIAPSAVSIVTAQDIKNYGYRTIAEILESMRGLYVTNDRAYSFLGGRGFGRPGDFTGRIMLLLDGNPVNNNIYNSAGLGRTGIVDVALIDRVEYVSGPGSAVYGNNAFFGIINIITKHGHTLPGAKLTGERSSFNSSEAKLSYGKQFDNGLDMLLSASGYYSEGQNLYFPDTQALIPGSNGIAKNLDETRSHQLFAKFEWQDWKAEVAYSKRNKDIPTAPYGADFNAPFNYDDQYFLADVKYNHTFTDDLKFSLNTYLSHYHYRGLQTFSTFSFPSSPSWRESSEGSWWVTNAQFLYDGFQSQRLIFGTEFRNDFKQTLTTPFDEFNTDEKTISFYGHDEISLTDSVTLGLGGRFEFNRDRFGHVRKDFSPRASVIYKPWDNTSIKLSWSQAFRRANPFERFYTDGFLLQNPHLDSEKIHAKELVIEQRIDTTSKALLSVYQYNTNDYIKSISLPANSQFQNTDGGEAKGIELEYEKRWLDGAHFRVSGAIQHSEDETGAWAINSPVRIGKINLSAPFYDRWRAGVELQAYSDRLSERDTVVSGYTLANVTINKEQVLPNLDVSLGIRNLFDREYDLVAPRSNAYQISIPQDGRTYWLRMSYQFK